MSCAFAKITKIKTLHGYKYHKNYMKLLAFDDDVCKCNTC